MTGNAMSFRLTTGFSHALREESAKRIAVLAGVSLRAARSLAIRLACWRWDAAISRARWWRRVVERMDGAR